jgi:hypothetical protein
MLMLLSNATHQVCESRQGRVAHLLFCQACGTAARRVVRQTTPKVEEYTVLSGESWQNNCGAKRSATPCCITLLSPTL